MTRYVEPSLGEFVPNTRGFKLWVFPTSYPDHTGLSKAAHTRVEGLLAANGVGEFDPDSEAGVSAHLKHWGDGGELDNLHPFAYELVGWEKVEFRAGDRTRHYYAPLVVSPPGTIERVDVIHQDHYRGELILGVFVDERDAKIAALWAWCS